MNKRIKRLIENLKYILNSELLKKIAIKTKFQKKIANLHLKNL